MRTPLSAAPLLSLLAATLTACAPGLTPTVPAASASPTAAAQPTATPSTEPTTQPTATPELLANLTGVWKGGSSGTYYLRQSGETVLWYGEHKATDPDWAQVAIGTRDALNQVTLDWFDVPKGSSQNVGTLALAVLPGGQLSAQNHTGALNETQWELSTPAPSYPLVDQAGPTLSQTPEHDFSGVWKDLSGARFYLTQRGQQIVGYAESSASQPEWSAVIYGKVSGSGLRLSWAGLPKSTQADFSFSSGAQRMTSANANILMFNAQLAGPQLGMDKWARVQ